MKKWMAILVIAATYVGTVVGAGFATGKEIVTFFSINGAIGAIGIAISGVLFIAVGTKMMIISARIQAYSYQEFNTYLFGNKIGKLVNTFIFIVVICITSVMLSGAGAVFHEQLGLPFQFGIMITLVFSYIVLLKGLKGLYAINSYIVPLMILFSLFIAGSIFHLYPQELLNQIIPEQLPERISWAVSPLAYSAFNLLTAQVVLVPLGKEIRDETILRRGGFLGGLVLTLLLLGSHFSLSVYPENFAYEIPMAELVKEFGTFIHVLFLFIIYGEIFNSVVGNIFGITRQLETTFHIRYQHAILLIMLVAFIISQIGYSDLLAFLYPLIGYIGLLLLTIVLVKKMPTR